MTFRVPLICRCSKGFYTPDGAYAPAHAQVQAHAKNSLMVDAFTYTAPLSLQSATSVLTNVNEACVTFGARINSYIHCVRWRKVWEKQGEAILWLVYSVEYKVQFKYNSRNDSCYMHCGLRCSRRSFAEEWLLRISACLYVSCRSDDVIIEIFS